MVHNDLVSCELLFYSSYLFMYIKYDFTFCDMLTRIRNAILVRSKKVYVIESNFIKSIVLVLKEQEFIDSYRSGFIFNGTKYLCLDLKYHGFSGVSYISSLRRVSRPGLRSYTSANKIPRVCGGLGGFVFLIVSFQSFFKVKFFIF